jgi:hypothetical protein
MRLKMLTSRRLKLLVVIGCLYVVPALYAAHDIPERIADDVFWQMVSDFSEPGGSFHSDNFVSNEILFERVVPKLKMNSGGAYIGVGPDQNFTYVVAIQPRIAFIIDIRRQAMLQHLMYKAIIELSHDRADFLSLLFSRHRPPDVGPQSSPTELFQALDGVPPDHALFDRNLRSILERLTVHHGFLLTEGDQHDIEYVYNAFFSHGPDLAYSTEPAMPTYAQLMQSTDKEGQNHSYLASETNFRILQKLQNDNLIIPIVGDFTGPRAIRAVAGYLKEHDTLVSAFYTSNVEQYLYLQGTSNKFYANVAELPVGPQSTFIRWIPKGSRYTTAPKRNTNALCPIAEFMKALNDGDIRNYREVLMMTN